ncbi:MAG TPA: hypothetical protein VG457_18345, partial [Planctomycetota bacterium]|nr:hypothetical protein [Planctomycetota bacterium]
MTGAPGPAALFGISSLRIMGSSLVPSQGTEAVRGTYLLPESIIGMKLLAAVALLLVGSARAPDPEVLALWPGAVPGDAGIPGAEKDLELKVNGKPYEVGGKPTRWITNVSKPSLTIYRPAKDKDTGVSMLIAPGGGYHNLGWDVEGEEVARWLNSIGVSAFILKYRHAPRYRHPAPLQDAQRALR